MGIFDNQNEDFSAVFSRKPRTEEHPVKSDDSNEHVDEFAEENDIESDIVETSQAVKNDDEKLTQYRTAKYSDEDVRKLKIIERAMGLTPSAALRWCLKTAYETKGEDLELIAKEIEKIERKMRKIRAQQ